MLQSILYCLVFVATLVIAAPASSTTGPAIPQSTACGDIVNSSMSYFQSNMHMTNMEVADYSIFYASEVYACLTSIPFNADVATRFISYYNDTMQFQSTLAYLKNPPSSYQQLPIDFVDGLQKIQDKVDAGYYLNEYAFEAELQTLVYSVHDAHVNLVAGALAAFTFGSPFDLVTASPDGKEVPRVYLWSINHESIVQSSADLA